MAEDERIDGLYDLPLDEFTAARNELAKELRASDREAAEEVKGLRKPSAAAWALNQAVRRDSAGLKEFLDAAGELRDAHEALLGGGEREALEAATQRERRAAGALAHAAEEAAGGGGPGLRDKVAGTLRAAVADEEARAELESGRVVREREAVGLGPVGAAPARGGRKRSQKADRQRGARKELDEARERERRAQRRLEAAKDTLDRAQREEEKARAAQEQAAEEVKGAERRLR